MIFYWWFEKQNTVLLEIQNCSAEFCVFITEIENIKKDRILINSIFIRKFLNKNELNAVERNWFIIHYHFHFYSAKKRKWRITIEASKQATELNWKKYWIKSYRKTSQVIIYVK